MATYVYEVWGCIVSPEVDGQKVSDHLNKLPADQECERLNNDPQNHPDLHYWVSKELEDV